MGVYAGAKARDDRLFLEAPHYFSVHNISCRAPPERFGKWNSVWKRFDRLRKAGAVPAKPFTPHLASDFLFRCQNGRALIQT